MREKITKLYKYAELTPEAQAKAREWFGRVVAEDYEAYCIYEDAATLAEFMGLDIRQRKMKGMDGKTRWGVSIYYSLYSQGSGASFTGSWRAVNVQAGKVIEHAPQDAELARIAGEFERIAHLRPDASLSSADSQRNGMRFDVETNPPEDFDDIARSVKEWEAIRDRENAIANELREVCRDFAQWVCKQILSDYEWMTSDAETLAEGIEANEYEFTADGEHES